jgi:hypothetical protein
MCDFVKLYYAVFTKGFNLILEYNHVTILSKYLFSLLSPFPSAVCLADNLQMPII